MKIHKVLVQGSNQTVCGVNRPKNTTVDSPLVTCKKCLKEREGMELKNAIQIVLGNLNLHEPIIREAYNVLTHAALSASAPAPAGEVVEKGVLSCPFCGAAGLANIHFISEVGGILGQIICGRCNGRTGGDLQTFEEAVKKWNTRPRLSVPGKDAPIVEQTLPIIKCRKCGKYAVEWNGWELCDCGYRWNIETARSPDDTAPGKAAP
jgi:hypothetical protein